MAITRKDHDGEEFSRLVVSEGGKAILLPTIDVVPKDPEVVDKFISIMGEKKHNYCAFMSSRAVEVLFDLAERIDKVEEVILALNSTIIVAIGPKTKSTLISHGIDVKMMPEEYSSEGLACLFSKMDNDIVKGKRIIIPRSGKSKELPLKALCDLGMIVEDLFLYDIKTSCINAIWDDFIELLKQKKVDGIIFTSASTVQSFFEIMHTISYNAYPLLSNVRAIIAIGPATGEELRKRNIKPLEPKEHTIRGTFEIAKIALSEK